MRALFVTPTLTELAAAVAADSRRCRSSGQSHSASVQRHHPGHVAAGAIDGGRHRAHHRDGGRRRGQHTGHLPSSAPAGRHPVSPPDVDRRGSLLDDHRARLRQPGPAAAVSRGPAGRDRPARHSAHGPAVGGVARTGAGGVAPGAARGGRGRISLEDGDVVRTAALTLRSPARTGSICIGRPSCGCSSLTMRRTRAG